MKLPPGPVRGVVTFSLIASNTVVCATPLLAVALAKLLVPARRWRITANRWLLQIGEQWSAWNSRILAATQEIRWRIDVDAELRHDGSYLVIANHQSWADVFAMQKVLNRRIPFPKFFLKQELIWVPVMGLAWWAMEMPFMKRYSREYLEKHPEKKGRDLEITRRACEKFKAAPTAIINFVEGTRFTPAKRDATASPYRHLLRPRAGGISYVLTAMGTCLQSILDVTIAYPEGLGGFWALCSGRIRSISVDVRERAIEPWLTSGDYAEDAEFRTSFQQWIAGVWKEKDALLDGLTCHGQESRH
jgi:1-acyl-sn-glycerol-3-phosphate acyltransferase